MRAQNLPSRDSRLAPLLELADAIVAGDSRAMIQAADQAERIVAQWGAQPDCIHIIEALSELIAEARGLPRQPHIAGGTHRRSVPLTESIGVVQMDELPARVAA